MCHYFMDSASLFISQLPALATNYCSIFDAFTQHGGLVSNIPSRLWLGYELSISKGLKPISSSFGMHAVAYLQYP
ncbi:peptidyl-prolyl cis-trans isomerase cwc27-like protein [Moniliophthora roreri]|nr:peptidyl-prolyl cis-trans isomerase cwc27-like protein [Moniliophthora roreri]